MRDRERYIPSMDKNEESGSPGWSASFFMQTTEDVARAVAAAAAAAVAARSPRPSVVYSSKEDSGGQLQKLQHQVSRLLKGLSTPSEMKTGPYNPEILTSQKRQWASFQLQYLVFLSLLSLLDAELISYWCFICLPFCFHMYCMV